MPVSNKTVGYVLGQVRKILNDEGGDAWDEAALISYLNIAQREVCNFRPEACVQTIIIDLDEGSSQTLTPDKKSLVDVVCNVGPDDREGRCATFVRREDMDRVDAAWRESDRDQVVREWAYDDRNPLSFDVSPPNDGTGRLKVEVYATPQDLKYEDDIGYADQPVHLSDEYLNAMIYWTCRVAYTEESSSPEFARRAEEFRLMFMECLQLQAAALDATEPGMSPEEVGTPDS